jgi:hypothetical protein
VAAQFDDYKRAGDIRSDPLSDRGFEARLRYLLEHRGGGEAIHAAGLHPRPARVVDWLTGDISPRAQTRRQIDQAYQALRRRNVARSLKARLAGGRRVTVDPLPASAVPPEKQVRQGQFDEREVSVSGSTFDRLVDAWEDDDQDDMDDIWVDDVAGDMGSPPEAYYEVAYVGFSI